MNPFRIFYGWWIVAASFFITLYVGGVVFYGFTAIFTPITAELGWSYTQVSLASSLRGLEAGLLAPLVGILTDRLGPRKLIFAGGILIALGLILLSHTDSLVTFYGAFGIMALGSSLCTITVLMTAIANWFRSKVGIASGIAICGFGFSGLFVPLIVRLIDLYEWRTAIFILAIGAFVAIVPLSLLFRHKPEQYGHVPDGYLSGKENYSQPNGEREFRALEAFKTGNFWKIAVVFLFHMAILSAIVTHVMPYLTSVGIPRSISSIVAAAIPLASIIGRIGLGRVGDKLEKRKALATSFTIMCIGVILFAYAPGSVIWLMLFCLLLGAGYGGNNALRPALVRDYYGRSDFGSIFGLIVGVSMLGEIMGPVLAGWAYDTLGSYDGIWYFYAFLSLVAITLILTIRPTKKPA